MAGSGSRASKLIAMTYCSALQLMDEPECSASSAKALAANYFSALSECTG